MMIEWTSVKDDMPKEDNKTKTSDVVLVTVKDINKGITFVHIDQTNCGKWMAFDLYGDRNRYDVLAWMSKPDPYVPEEN